MKTSLLILCASLAVAAAQPLNNFHWVPAAKEVTKLYIVECGGPTTLQFIHHLGQGVWIKQSPNCQPPKLHSTTTQNRELEVNSDTEFKFEALECRRFAVLVPGSQTKIPEIVICID